MASEFLLFVIVFGFAFLLLSIYLHNHIMIIFASFILMLAGIYTTINGLLGQFNWFTIAIGVFIVGVSIFIVAAAPYDMLEDT